MINNNISQKADVSCFLMRVKWSDSPLLESWGSRQVQKVGEPWWTRCWTKRSNSFVGFPVTPPTGPPSFISKLNCHRQQQQTHSRSPSVRFLSHICANVPISSTIENESPLDPRPQAQHQHQSQQDHHHREPPHYLFTSSSSIWPDTLHCPPGSRHVSSLSLLNVRVLTAVFPSHARARSYLQV